jgi:hypothetical protein
MRPFFLLAMLFPPRTSQGKTQIVTRRLIDQQTIPFCL